MLVLNALRWYGLQEKGKMVTPSVFLDQVQNYSSKL